ncbi:MAG: hypothetical protein J7647_27275 [Cyanobacteria bacterium SBLK]|nr:hypothetical protein [Cyanobacteria bacterium SBLK]
MMPSFGSPKLSGNATTLKWRNSASLAIAVIGKAKKYRLVPRTSTQMSHDCLQGKKGLAAVAAAFALLRVSDARSWSSLDS